MLTLTALDNPYTGLNLEEYGEFVTQANQVARSFAAVEKDYYESIIKLNI